MAAEIRISPKGEAVLERVLIVDSVGANVRLLSEILRAVGQCHVQAAPSDMRGLIQARDFDPQIIFVELSAPDVNGLDFTRKLRRSEFSCREAPVIMITAEATAAGIMAARDAGVHEFLRRPYNMGDLQKRIDAVALKKRDWVEAVAYIGPDRRRFNSADYSGPLKRGTDDSDPENQRIAQALKIVAAATAAIESDPKQVFRSLKAQVETLLTMARANPKLRPVGQAAVAFQLYLGEAVKTGRLSREKIELLGQALWDAAPPEARPGDAPKGYKAA